MMFFKREHKIRRFSAPVIIKGYTTIPWEEKTMLMDVQTLEDASETGPDGTRSVQRLKVFCDEQLFTEEEQTQQKADRLWFQGKWFECRSSRLSENTPLRHWTSTFVELPYESEVEE